METTPEKKIEYLLKELHNVQHLIEIVRNSINEEQRRVHIIKILNEELIKLLDGIEYNRQLL